MSNRAFQQNLNDKKGPQPGDPYLIQMLVKEPVEMPDKEKMTAVMEKHIGSAAVSYTHQMCIRDRYHSDEFQDEAYLFIPFDEDYYPRSGRSCQ